MCKEIKHTPPTAVEQARSYINKMIEKENAGWGDQKLAIGRIELRYGLPFWTLNNLRIGRAKTVEAGLFARIKAAYIDLCERQIARLQHEIKIEMEITGNDFDADFLVEVQTLVERVRAARKG